MTCDRCTHTKGPVLHNVQVSGRTYHKLNGLRFCHLRAGGKSRHKSHDAVGSNVADEVQKPQPII